MSANTILNSSSQSFSMSNVTLPTFSSQHLTQPLTFKAVWSDKNKHLEESTIEKITRYAFFLINKIATALILPSLLVSKYFTQEINNDFRQSWESPENSFLTRNFTATPIEVTTPDNIPITGTYFKNAAATESSPTVIFFQPNGMPSKTHLFRWALFDAAIQEVPYNFVYFDYRGTDGTDNTPVSGKNLYLDGESIYQFVRDKLHVPAKDIHFYGYSLGGGISLNVKKLHQEECTGKAVNERSFTSISDVIKNILNKQFFAVIAVPLAYIATFFVSILNWNIDAASALENLKGKLLIVHHPKDELMEKEASLYRHVFERAQVTTTPEVSHLDLSRSQEQDIHFHGTPLQQFRATGFNATEEVSRFLFSTNLSKNQRLIQIYRNSTSANFRNKVHKEAARIYQNGGHYWGSGEDACNNRNGLSLTESQLAYAITLAKIY